MTTQGPTATSDLFLFRPEDLVAWTTRRKDGSTVTYVLGDTGTFGRKAAKGWQTSVTERKYPQQVTGSSGSLSQYCVHNPAKEPTFVDPKGKFEL